MVVVEKVNSRSTRENVTEYELFRFEHIGVNAGWARHDDGSDLERVHHELFQFASGNGSKETSSVRPVFEYAE